MFSETYREWHCWLSRQNDTTPNPSATCRFLSDLHRRHHPLSARRWNPNWTSPPESDCRDDRTTVFSPVRFLFCAVERSPGNIWSIEFFENLKITLRIRKKKAWWLVLLVKSCIAGNCSSDCFSASASAFRARSSISNCEIWHLSDSPSFVAPFWIIYFLELLKYSNLSANDAILECEGRDATLRAQSTPRYSLRDLRPSTSVTSVSRPLNPPRPSKCHSRSRRQ